VTAGTDMANDWNGFTVCVASLHSTHVSAGADTANGWSGLIAVLLLELIWLMAGVVLLLCCWSIAYLWAGADISSDWSWSNS